MKNDSLFSRRRLLKIGGISAIALGASGSVARGIAEICEATPKQPEGPFYPVEDQPDKNNDLTMVVGKTEMALGNIIYLSGIVKDQNCQPVPGVLVEIWQACETGKYNHPGDHENPNPLDPNFQYWGISISNAEGRYDFKTILPGHYSAGPNWIRPPHIHFKVHKRGIRELITQMYFAGNRYNDGDLILKAIPRDEWPSVVRETVVRPSENGRETFEVSFDISVQRLQ
jgi:protocatechuate 3,4-dioxygenase beta subunit